MADEDPIEPVPLVTLEQLEESLEWELSDDERRLANSALEDLSDDARFYGSHTWTTPATTPRQARSLVRRAVSRHLRNPDGFTVSRAGDETVGWTDKGDEGGVLTFKDREIKMLRQLAGKRGVTSVPIYAWGQRDPVLEGLVPVADGGDPFPYFGSASPYS